MNLSKHIKYFIIGLTLAACINSNASALSGISKKGLIKTPFTPLQIGVVGNLFATDNVYGFSFALPISYVKNNYGFATGIWGESNDHRGIQLNVINLANELDGVQIGLFGMMQETEGCGSELAGVQMNVIGNVAESLFGFQSGIYNQSGRLNGMQSGFVNLADQGLQLGLVNIFNSKQSHKGMDCDQTDARIQVGIYNHSSNSAFQIGALNYNKNGFLPVFILFNFSIN
jgi:hypothetical protein